jgi:putative membrane protein
LKFRWLLRLLLVLGGGAILVLIIRSGVGPIVGLLSGAGWKLLLLVPLHALPLALDVAGWHVLIQPRNRWRTLFFIATIREAINRLLPVANVGGEIVGIRLLSKRGTEAMTAAASVVVETLITLIAQFLFIGLGVWCLARLEVADGLVAQLLLGLGISVPMLAILFLLLRFGTSFEWLGKIARRIMSSVWPNAGVTGQGAAMDAAIRRILSMRGALAVALGWQFIGLIAGCAETWLALTWLGHPVGLSTALVLESLTQAIRHFIFIVPAGLGVQEAGLMGLGLVLGVPTGTVIALSLAKRMREVLFGVPALLAWQWTRKAR